MRDIAVRSGNLEKGVNFAKAIGNTGSTIFKGAPGFVINAAQSAVRSVDNFWDPIAKTVTGFNGQELDRIDKQSKALDTQMDDAVRQFRAGSINKEQYNERVKAIGEGYKELSGRSKVVTADTNPAQFVNGALDTAMIILSAGSYAPAATSLRASAGLRTAVFFRGAGLTSKVLGSRAGAAILKLEDIAARVPSVKALMARNGAKFANTSRSVLNQSVRDAAMGALIKHPFLYHYTVEDVKDIFTNINEDRYGGALGKFAWVATLTFEGGPLGKAIDTFKWGSSKLKVAALGRASYLDKMSASLKGGNPYAWREWVDEATTAAEKTRRIGKLRQHQEMQLRRFLDNVDEAVSATLYHVTSNAAIDPSTITPKEYFTRMDKYLTAFEEIHELAKRGLIKGANGEIVKAGSIALGTFDQAARDGLIQELSKLSYMARVKYLNQLKDSNVFWTQNEIMFNRVLKIVSDTDDIGKVSDVLKGIDTQIALKGLPKGLAKRLAQDGYIVITPKTNLSRFVEEQDTRKLITDYINKGDEVFDTAVLPVPVLSGFYGGLKRIGLSAEAANKVAYKELSRITTANLSRLGIADQFYNKGLVGEADVSGAGRVILSKLQQFAETKRPAFGGKLSATNAITDIRQLTLKEIQEALSSDSFVISRSQAKDVADAITRSYMELPLEFRGLGDRAVDVLFKSKFVPGFKSYNRVQSALRYTYNPFFRLQEIVETKLLSKMQAGSLIWGKSRSSLDKVAKKLDDAGFFNTGFSGEGARDDVVLGRITANLTRYQKRDLAGLAEAIARKQGTSVDKLLQSNPDVLEDALKVVVQYPSRGAISSPLARTINLAFFPARYNLKVAGLVAKELAKQPPAIQYAVINSTFRANDWLKSDEGLVWQAENSEAIGLLKWITPYGSLDYVTQLLNGRPDSISDLGQLGGLPAGFIFQILDSNGVFQNLPGGAKFTTPYVDPKTGEVYADKIPLTLKARAAISLQDFINSTFTYPGRVVGLPGKGEFIRTGVDTVLDTDYDEYDRVVREDELTELQRRQSQLLKTKALGDMDDDEILSLFTTEDGRWSTPSLPLLIGQPTSVPNKFKPRRGLPSSKKSKGPKAKKRPLPIPPRD